MFQAPSTTSYYPVSWPTAPAAHASVCLVLNSGQLPVYHLVTKANGMNSKEQVKIFKTGGAQKGFNEENKERVASARLQHFFLLFII